MLEYLLPLFIGFVLGFLAGLGIGGGSILIIWLTLFAEIPQNDARAVNLLFFLAAAGSVSIFRWKKGNLNIKEILPAIICGCLSAALFSWISGNAPLGIIKKIFGGLLIITGIRELLYRPRKAK